MNKLPIYEALINDETDGVYAISLVSEGATQVDWLCFNTDDKLHQFAIDNEEEHILAGVVMVADTPIYRRNDNGYEYYITYSRDTIKILAEKMLKDNTFNSIDIQHNGEYLPKGLVNLRELFIKDTDKGICPSYFENVPDGSLLCTYKVNDDELWEICKNGGLNSFSLAGYFSTERLIEEYNNQEKNKNITMKDIKEMLRKFLAEMAEVKTDKGVITWNTDEDLKEGDNVFIDGDVAEDGEYVTEDGKVITIKDGKVETIADAEAEVAPEEEVMEEEEVKEEKEEEVVEEVKEDIVKEVVEDKNGEDIEALKAEIDLLKKEIEDIKSILSQPVAEPITEEFSAVDTAKDDNVYAKIGKAIRG